MEKLSNSRNQLVLALGLALGFSLILACCGKPINDNAPSFDYEEGVFLVLFQNESKNARIVRSFNAVDGAMYSHVGLVMANPDSTTLIHVHPDYIINRQMVSILPLDSFLMGGSRINEVWQIDLGYNEVDSLRLIVSYFKAQEGRFDWNFDYNSTDLYCSEFLQKSFEMLDPGRFEFPMLKRPLNFLLGRVLKRDSLEFFPVDFFITNPYFTKVYPN